MEQRRLSTIRFHEWRMQNISCTSHYAPFEEWVFVQAAGVLFEQKAGELLTLSAGQFGLMLMQQLSCLKGVAAQWDVQLQILQQNDVSIKVILYLPALVETRLREMPPEILCNTLGYRCMIDPDAFVSEVGRRWRERGEIPHEIGLALGYPVKDVLGYMGLQSLTCTGCCGWRIYGDPTPSLAMSYACQDATRRALRLLYQPANQSYNPADNNMAA